MPGGRRRRARSAEIVSQDAARREKEMWASRALRGGRAGGRVSDRPDAMVPISAVPVRIKKGAKDLESNRKGDGGYERRPGRGELPDPLERFGESGDENRQPVDRVPGAVAVASHPVEGEPVQEKRSEIGEEEDSQAANSIRSPPSSEKTEQEEWREKEKIPRLLKRRPRVPRCRKDRGRTAGRSVRELCVASRQSAELRQVVGREQHRDRRRREEERPGARPRRSTRTIAASAIEKRMSVGRFAARSAREDPEERQPPMRSRFRPASRRSARARSSSPMPCCQRDWLEIAHVEVPNA